MAGHLVHRCAAAGVPAVATCVASSGMERTESAGRSVRASGWVPQPPSALPPAGPGWDEQAPHPTATAPEESPSQRGRWWHFVLPAEVRVGTVGVRLVHVVVVGIVLAIGLGLGVVAVLRSQPEQVPAAEPVDGGTSDNAASPSTSSPDTSGPDTSGSETSSPAPTERPEQIAVHVAGDVGEPGVVRLESGSRVVDAIEAAGGAAGDAEMGALNLAQVLRDGQQVLVGLDAEEAEDAPGGVLDPEHSDTGSTEPTPTDPGAGAAEPGGADGSDATATVDINTAGLEELQVLPGIGPALAQRILDWREQHGQFNDVNELLEVSGIGDATLAELKDAVTL